MKETELAVIPNRRSGARPLPSPAIQEAVRRVLLSGYVPAAVLIDDEMNVLHIHGRASSYLGLPEGVQVANLMKLKRVSLLVLIRAAVLRAKSEDRTVSKIARCKVDGRQEEVSIDVLSVRIPLDRRRRYLIVFKPLGAPAGDAAAGDALSLFASSPASSGPQTRDPADEKESALLELRSTNHALTEINDELSRSNRLMAAANEEHRNLMASAGVPLVALDRNMRLHSYTAEAEGIFGFDHTMLGQPFARLKLGVELPDAGEALQEVLVGCSPKNIEVHDRHNRWYSLWIRPYMTAANIVDGAILWMTDVTERRAAIHELKSSRDYAQALVDAVNDPLLILNGHLKVRSASRFYYKVFKCAPAEVEGRSIYELGEGLWNVSLLRKALSRMIVSKEPFSGVEGEFEVPRLGRRTLTFSGRIVPSEGASGLSIVVCICDVSQRKQAAEAAALRKSESRQREFVANVSHELMTPITAIKGYAESLIAGALEVPGQRVKFAQIIEKHADRLTQLVEDILHLSVAEGGRGLPAPEAVALKGCIERLVRGMAPVARRRAVSFRMRISDGLRVAISRAELTQVLQNVCENAIKYNRKRGRVLISARQIGKRALVGVYDTGIGVPKNDLTRIFDRFHRAENARLMTERGSGLGLSIVRAILDNHGCRAWAESVEGKGTTIFFTLPLAAGRRSRRAERHPADELK